MTPTPKGDSVILTRFTEIYTLSIKESNYEWIQSQYDMSIKRNNYVEALVPASTIQCNYGMLSFYKNIYVGNS